MPGILVSPTPQQIDQAEREIRQELATRANQQLSEVKGVDDVHVRDIIPPLDLDEDDANNDNSGWDGNTREWLQGGYDAGADALNQVYEVDSDGNADNTLLAIIAVSFATPDPHVTEIEFQDGTGSTFERLQVQGIQTFSEGAIGLLSEPIIFDADEDGTIHHWPTNTNDSQVIYHGAASQKAGKDLGKRSKGRPGPQQQANARQVA